MRQLCSKCRNISGLEIFESYEILWKVAVCSVRGGIFTTDLLPQTILNGTNADKKYVDQEEDFDLAKKERELIVQALQQCYWNQSQAAQQLGITRNTLRYRVKKHGIQKD